MKIRTLLLVTILLSAFASQGQWFRVDSISSGNLYSMHFVNADTGFTYHMSSTMRKTTDGGITWDTMDMDFSGFIHDIKFASANVGYAVGGAWFPFGQHYANAILKTTDGGETWDSVFGNYNHGVFNHVEVLSELEFYAAGHYGLIHSSDGGVTLDSVLPSSLLYEEYLKTSFPGPNTGYILGKFSLGGGTYLYNLYKTTDAGTSWQSVYSDTLNMSARDFVMTNSGFGLLTDKKGLVMKTADGGNSWQKLQLPDTSVLLHQVTEVDGDVYAIGHNAADSSNGIYRSRDWGNTWSVEYSSNASSFWIEDMSFPTQEVGYFSTFRELYKNDQLVSIGEQPSYAGFQLYPNPSSGQVFIELHESDEAEVSIFNSLGQRVSGSPVPIQSRIQLDVGHLPTGFYLVEVLRVGNRFVERLVKE